MLPIKLSIEGLYSYQDKQTIDFENLTNAGLFGIFGAVGSGKSSILEAISFALYGETERLNKSDKRAYNMLNLKSKKAEIIFEFQNFDGQIFQFCCQWKRKKRFDDIEKISRTAYQKIEGNWTPLESVHAEKVVGLNYDNFRRTIIIPQGKFQDFLQLGGSERSAMMKEIFNLQKFDLFNNVRYINSKNKSKIDELTGRLSTFLEFTPEVLEEKSTLLQEVSKNLIALKANSENLEKELKTLQVLNEKLEQLKKVKDELDKLNSQKKEMEQLEQKVNSFEKTNLHFSALLKQQSDFEKKEIDLKKEIELVEIKLNLLQSSLKKEEQELEQIKPKYAQLDQWKNQDKEYDFLIQLKQAEKESSILKSRMDKGAVALEKKKNEEKIALLLIENAEKEIEELKSRRINTEELIAVGDWYACNEALQNQKIKLEKSIEKSDKDNRQYQDAFAELNLDLNNWENEIKSKAIELEQQKEGLHQQIQHLLLAQELSHFAHSLEDGKPCMLCGSEAHPDIMETQNVKDQLSVVEQQKLVVDKQINAQQELKITTQRLVDTMQIIAKQKQESKLELDKIIAEEHLLSLKFIWSNYKQNDKTEFIEKKAEAGKINQEISDKESVLKTGRGQMEQTKSDVLKFGDAIQEFKNQDIAFCTQIQQHTAQIKQLILADYSEKETDAIIQEQKQLKQKIEQVRLQFEQLNKHIQDENNKIATATGMLISAQKQFQKLREDLQILWTEINEALHKFNFQSLEDVKEILAFNLDIDSEKKKISNFKNQLFNISQNLSTYQKELEGKTFDADAFQTKNNTYLALKTQLSELIGQEASLKSEQSVISEKIKIRLELETILKQLNLRADNLKTLSNMFSANGFLNFVSGIYLEHLCNSANVRFRKLSKNQMELCLNEKNEFEVRDFLNEGHCRSVKTLSGGQTFQASLSLALALAESVQSLNKSGKNFFFIDEGFGTQDKEMIQVVFETLQALNKDNRIVGIISHVEELQEQIPISLTITKDEARGSLINQS